jgi:hypothetical protein
MAATEDLEQLSHSLNSGILLTVERIRDLQLINTAAAAAASAHKETLSKEVEQWDAQRSNVSGGVLWGKKKELAVELLAAGNFLEEKIKNLVQRVTDQVKIPRHIMSSVALATSRISRSEQMINTLRLGGGDVSEAVSRTEKLRATKDLAADYVTHADLAAAFDLTGSIDEQGNDLTSVVNEVAAWVDTLPRDIAEGNAAAKRVDALAMGTAEQITSECPAHPESLRVLNASRESFDKALGFLEQLAENPTRENATTIVYSALELLTECESELTRVFTLESERNLAYAGLTSTQEALLVTLSSFAGVNAGMWELFDSAAGLLGIGELEQAADAQHKLVRMLEPVYYPALASAPWGENTGNAEPEQQIRVAGPGPIGLAEEALRITISEDPLDDLEQLRALVNSLTVSVNSLTSRGQQ